MKLIVGFGNPGERFANNRQNIGFKVIDILANNENIEVRIKKKKSVIGRGRIYKHDVVLLKPQTFIKLFDDTKQKRIVELVTKVKDNAVKVVG